MTSTSLMTWRSCHTIIARCRIRPLSWRPHQQEQGSRSTGRRRSWWRWTQLLTHQSQLLDSPSGRWSPSSTWEVWLTNREVQTEMSQPELSRQQQLHHAQKHLEESAWELNSASSKPIQQCEVSPALWMWDIVDNIDNTIKDNTCLRCIYKIQWQENIRNEDLWERAGQDPVAKQILRRKRGWIGHTLRKPASSTTRQALTWNPQGKRMRPALQQLEVRHWCRAETARDQLDWIGQSRPEQSVMARGRRWPMLHQKQWA